MKPPKKKTKTREHNTPGNHQGLKKNSPRQEKVLSDEVIELTSTSEDESPKSARQRKTATWQLSPASADSVIELTDDDEVPSCASSSLSALNRSGRSQQRTPASGSPASTPSSKREMTRRAKFADNVPSSADTLPVVEVHTSVTSRDTRALRLPTQVIGSLTQRLFSQSFLHCRNTQTITLDPVKSRSSIGNNMIEGLARTSEDHNLTESTAAPNFKTITDYHDLDIQERVHIEERLQTPDELTTFSTKEISQPSIVRDKSACEPEAEPESLPERKYTSLTEIAAQPFIVQDDTNRFLNNLAAVHKPVTKIEVSPGTKPTSHDEIFSTPPIVQDDINPFPGNDITPHEPKSIIEDSSEREATSLTTMPSIDVSSSLGDHVITHEPETNVEGSPTTPIGLPEEPFIVRDETDPLSADKALALELETNYLSQRQRSNSAEPIAESPALEPSDPQASVENQPVSLGQTSSMTSLMSSNDSSLPATPDPNNSSTLHIPSTTLDRELNLELYTKTLETPTLPPVPETDDDDFLLSQGLTYPDFGTIT